MTDTQTDIQNIDPPKQPINKWLVAAVTAGFTVAAAAVLAPLHGKFWGKNAKEISELTKETMKISGVAGGGMGYVAGDGLEMNYSLQKENYKLRQTISHLRNTSSHTENIANEKAGDSEIVR